jgi:hypothetical protein
MGRRIAALGLQRFWCRKVAILVRWRECAWVFKDLEGRVPGKQKITSHAVDLANPGRAGQIFWTAGMPQITDLPARVAAQAFDPRQVLVRPDDSGHGRKGRS